MLHRRPLARCGWLYLSASLFWIAGGGMAAATELPLNFALTSGDGYNRFAITIDPVGISQLSPDTETANVYGGMQTNLDLTFDPVTHAATVGGISFANTQPGSLAFSNMEFNLKAFGLITVETIDVNNLAGTLNTPSPPGVVTGGSFAVDSHQFIFNAGTLVGTGQASLNMDLAATPLTSALNGAAGTITISAPSVVGNLATYNADLLLPISSTITVTTGVNVVATGTFHSTTQFTQVLQTMSLYWDANGTAPGAGANPSGVWGVGSNWNTDSSGGGAGTFFVHTPTYTSDLNFSAGSDAIGPTAVTLNGIEAAQSLTFNSGHVTIAGAGTINLDGNSSGAIVTNQDATISCQVGGAVGLTKLGAAALTLNGANAYTGGTHLMAGTLNVNNPSALSTGTLTISGGTLDNTSGAPVTLTTNNPINWNGDFTFTGSNDLNLGTGLVYFTHDRTVTVNAGNLTIGGVLVDDGYGLYTLTKAGAGTLTLSGDSIGADRITSGIELAAGRLNINNAGAVGYTLTLDGGTIDNTSGAPVTFTAYVQHFWNGDFHFAGTNDLNLGVAPVVMSGSRTVTVDAGNLTVGGNIWGDPWDGKNYSLTKAGPGTLTLTGNNNYTQGGNYTGGTILAGGVLAFGTRGIPATGAITFSGGTLQWLPGNTDSLPNNVTVNGGANAIFDTNGNVAGLGGPITGPGGLTKLDAGTLVLSGANSYGGATTISQGTLQIGGGGGTSGTLGSGPVTNSGALVFNRSDATTVSNAISGTGSVTLAAGTVTLSGANSYGATTVNGGQLIIGNNLTNSGVLTVAGGAVSHANCTVSAAGEYIGYMTSGAGAYAQSGGTNAVGGIEQIGYGPSAGTYTLNGGLNSVGGLKFGNNQPNDVSATYNLNGGTLAVGSSGITYGTQCEGAPPTWSFNLGGGTLQATSSFTVSNTNSWLVMALAGSTTSTIDTQANTVTLQNSISGAGSLSKTGSGTLILSGGNSYGGATTIGQGTLQIGAGGTSGTLGGGAVTDNGSLVFNRSNAVTVNNAIGGTGSLTQAGSGTLILANANTYSGVTTISSGVLSITNGNALQNSTLVYSTGSLQWLGLTAVTLGGLSGSNNLYGQTSTVALTVGGNGQSTAYSGVLSVNGPYDLSLTKTGSGALALSGANTYTAGTTLAVGALQIGADSVYGSGSITSSAVGRGILTLNGGTLSSNGTAARTLYNAYTLGGDVTLGDATNNGALTLSGAGTLTGARTLAVNSAAAFNGALGDGGHGYGITKNGAGTLTLGATVAANTFTGPITLDNGGLTVAGTVSASSIAVNGGNFTAGASTSGSMGFGPVAISGGTLTDACADAFRNNTVTFNAGVWAWANGFYSPRVGGLAGSANIALKCGNGNGSVAFVAGCNNSSTTYSGIFSDGSTIGGGNSIVKMGTGSWTLTGASTMTGSDLFNDLDNNHNFDPSYTFSAVAGSGALVIGANGNTSSGGPVGKGNLLIAKSAYAGSTTPTLTSNSTSGYTISNPVYFSGTNNDVVDPTVGGVILGDAGNDALTLSGPATLVGFSHGLYRDSPDTAVATAMTMTMTTPGNGVTISGAIGEVVAGSGIIKAGAGKLTLSGNNTYSGTTTVSAGVLELGTSARNPVFTGGGTDIRAGGIVFDYAGSDPAATIQGLLAASYHGGLWNTGQFRSSTASPSRGLGWSDDSLGKVTVAYALYGDANLDGTVNGADLNIVLSNYNQTGAGWNKGDFNYDGAVNGADLNIVLSNYNQVLSVASAVPEPSTLASLGFGAIGLLGYAWRKRQKRGT